MVEPAAADYHSIWATGDHSLPVRVEALEKLVATGALSIPACGCGFDAKYLAEWESLEPDQQDRELEALMSPLAEPWESILVDDGVADVASRLLSGYVSYLCNRPSCPLTDAALEDVRGDRVSTYVRPPHVPHLAAIVEDLQLLAGRERELGKRVSRKVQQLLDTLLAGRDAICACFFRQATIRELEAWAAAEQRRWLVRVYREPAQALGIHISPDEVDFTYEVPMDAGWAEHIAKALNSADEKHSRVRAVLERWRSLTPDDLTQPPAALYKQLQEAAASYKGRHKRNMSRQSPDD